MNLSVKEDKNLSKEPYSTEPENAFRLVGEMPQSVLVTLVTLLTGTLRTDEYIKLYSLFSRDVALFLTVFEGRTIKIPRLKYLVKQVGYCRIYNFVRSRGFTEEAYENAAAFFGKRLYNVRAVVAKVEREMAKIRDGIVDYPMPKEMRNSVTGKDEYSSGDKDSGENNAVTEEG